MTLAELQATLIKKKWDAYIVSRNNMFLGQDILAEENCLTELSGFTGSAGELLVFRDKAYLFVDGRYELQAAKETDSSCITVVVSNSTLATWMKANLNQPCTIAYDPWCHSISETDYWIRNLKDHRFIEDDNRLLGTRICRQDAEIFEHDVEFAGVSMNEKLSWFMEFMLKNNLEAYLMTDCDAVSWLMNLRSNCLPNTPVLRAFALIRRDGDVSLFTNDINRLEAELSSLKGKAIGLSYQNTPRKISSLMKNMRIWMVNLENPVQAWKAVKNPVELSGIKEAHLRDGVAMVRFLHWLANNWQTQDELSVTAKLLEFRQQNLRFFSNSFETIAGFAANGAIVHYHSSPQTNLSFVAGSVLLLDSGAQYLDGTTDITRTIGFGDVPETIKDSYTQVLKAHIAAASAYFPQGTSGMAIDAIARAQLWQYGKNYAHGTGHGVGCFLNVHEGPHRLGNNSSPYPLAENMITSIEPGYYQPQDYGIRIENLYYITPVPDQNFPSPMLCFEPLTLVPLDKCLINKYLLTVNEIEWLNRYHAKVEQQLSPLLDPQDRAWLHQACQPL